MKNKTKCEKVARDPNRGLWENPKPLQGQNELQEHYIRCIQESAITIATGYPGTGKTYIPARIAAEMYKRQEISNITLIRPNVSASKSMGYYPGSKTEKMTQWLAPVLSALREEFTNYALNSMMNPETNALNMCPLELIKGLSLNKSFIIVDEAEDLTIKEVKAILTRIGYGSKIVLCGDIQQADIRESGLSKFINMLEQDSRLRSMIGLVDFSDKKMIVRSPACKEIILGFERAGI